MIPHHENWYDRNAQSDSAISPPPSVIFKDFLYLSSAPTAAYLPHLLNAGITHVINLSSCSNYWASQSDINLGWARVQKTDKRYYASLVKKYGPDFGYIAPTYLHIDIEDAEDVSLSDHFLECIAFIYETCLQNPRARFLVHCYQGRSRSASIVIAYAMWACSMSYDEAFRYVRECRNSIAPNNGFVKQLLQFENELWLARNNKINKINNSSDSIDSSDSSDNSDNSDNSDDDDEINLSYDSRLDNIASLVERGGNSLNGLHIPVVVAT